MRIRLPACALIWLLAAPAFAAAPPSDVVTQAELAAGGKKQAKERFRRLPPDTKIRLADGRVLTKADLEAAAKRKAKPGPGARGGPSTDAPQLAKLNAELTVRTKAALDADAARLKDAFQRLPKGDAPKSNPISLKCLAPKVEAVFPLSNLTPGGWVMVTGCGFGSAGQLVLVLQQSNQQIPVGSLQWDHHGVAGQIPADHAALKTAVTQLAKLEVRTSVGTGTSPAATYRAGREVRLLPFDDYHVVVSTESDSDTCYGAQGRALCSHYTGPWDPLGGDIGTDKFSVTVKNGWVLNSWELTRGDGSTDWVGHSSSGAGASHAKHDVVWMTMCGDNCSCWYYLKVFVEGEIGTKWK